MLAHNASLLRVPFDPEQLFSVSFEDPYVEGLRMVVQTVKESHDRAEKNAKP